MNLESSDLFDSFKSQKTKNNFYSRLFIIKCDINLSFFAQKILESCCNKDFYQVLETIDYGLKFNLSERNYLLQVFNSIGISLQNHTNVRFFDIKVYNISIKNISQFNLLNCKLINSKFLRIHCFCKVKSQKKKKEPYW